MILFLVVKTYVEIFLYLWCNVLTNYIHAYVYIAPFCQYKK